MIKLVFLSGAASMLISGDASHERVRTMVIHQTPASQTVDTDDDVTLDGAVVGLYGRAGGDVTVNGFVVDLEARIGGDLDVNGDAIEVDARVAGDTTLNAGTLVMSGDFDGPVIINVGEAQVGGVYSDEVRINAGALIFDGDANAPVFIASSGSHPGVSSMRPLMGIEVRGELGAGGMICAAEVRFAEGADVSAPLTVVADESPQFFGGFDASQIDFEPREGRACSEV